MAEFRGKLEVTSSKFGGVKIGEDWYKYADDKVKGYASSLIKGDEVNGTYDQVKGSRIIKTIFKSDNTPVASAPTATGPKCEVCGKELKDNKYKKCYDCNLKGASAPVSTPAPTISTQAPTPPVEPPPVWKPAYAPKIGGYGSAEDVAGKEVGCAAGAAANLLSGRPEEIHTLLEMYGIAFQSILDRIRTAK